MAKIYTRTGDDGSTATLSGKRLGKDDLQIEAYGTVDELNSWIGLLADVCHAQHQKQFLRAIQNKLFSVGSLLAADDFAAKLPQIEPSDVTLLEDEIDNMNEHLPALRNFILPGGHPHISYAHLARTVCRRAERKTIALSRAHDVAIEIIKYLNRLSDYLFVLSRALAKELSVEEVKWES